MSVAMAAFSPAESLGYDSPAGSAATENVINPVRKPIHQDPEVDSQGTPPEIPVCCDADVGHGCAPPEGMGFSDKNAFGDEYRNYEDSARQETVARSYQEDHTNMTYDFVCAQEKKWLGATGTTGNFERPCSGLNHGEYDIWQVVEMLDGLVDESDPDNELPNSIHDFQTAERIRKIWPGEEYDWFHLIGLLHDIGKVMALWGEPQWCVVGDTYPVGCKHSDKIVFPQFFAANPDTDHPMYSTENGIYEPGCGIKNLKMAWGHDEYMYWVLKSNGCTLPEEGLQMIRYHSFYPWHTGGAYKQFEAPGDEETLRWVLEFNKFDLYSKGDEIPDVTALRPYYQGLLEKYNIAGKLRW